MQTVECRVAIESLLLFSDNPTAHRAEAQAALEHVRGCPDCRRRAHHLAFALTSDEEDQLTCEQCEDRMSDYLQAEWQGHAHETQWHSIALHLRLCPHCAALYAELTDLAALADDDHAATPPQYPTPDLSFLHSERAGTLQSALVPWSLDKLGRLVITFSTELLQTMRQTLRPPTSALAPVKSQASAQRYQLAIADAVDDLAATITVEPTRNDPQQCNVVVEVQIPSRGGWPHLAGTQVTLTRGEQAQETQMTDAFGKAVFGGIAVDELPRLVVAIAPPTSAR